MHSASLAALQAPNTDIFITSSRETVADTPLIAATESAPPLRPLFVADWIDTVMLHLAVPRRVLQAAVPLELDCIDGDGFVSLVAFRQRKLRPAWPRGGIGRRIGATLMRPLAAHDFLNVRTYVKHRGQAGIYFIAEVLSSRLATYLGPLLYGLPYSFGQVQYRHDLTCRELSGSVVQARTGRRLEYRAALPAALAAEAIAALPAAEAGSIDAFLMERYVAFTQRNGVQRRFRIAHAPWRQLRVQVELGAVELAAAAGGGGWWSCAKLAFANASPGVTDVAIGAPEV